jgi:hypothetical protein
MIAPRPFFICFAILLTAALAYVVYVTPLNCNDFLQHLFMFETRSFSDLIPTRSTPSCSPANLPSWRSCCAISNELKVAALLPVLLVASMIFGAFSQKDYIPLMALPVYVLTCFYALRWLLYRPLRPALLAVAIVLFGGWGVRTAGLFYYMHRMAYDYYEEWAVDAERLDHVDEFDRAMAMPLLERLRAQATSSPVTYPDYLLPKWLVEYLRGRGCPEFCGNYD